LLVDGSVTCIVVGKPTCRFGGGRGRSGTARLRLDRAVAGQRSGDSRDEFPPVGLTTESFLARYQMLTGSACGRPHPLGTMPQLQDDYFIDLIRTPSHHQLSIMRPGRTEMTKG
jgi:hypothetical protein